MYIKFTVPIEYKLFGHKQIEKKEFVAYFDPIGEPDLSEGILIDSEYIFEPNLIQFIDTCLVKKNRSDLLNKDYQLIISFFEDEDNNKGGYLLEYITEDQEVIFDREIELNENNDIFFSIHDDNVSIPYNNSNSISNSNMTGGFMNFNNKTKDKESDDKEKSGNQFKNSNGKLENQNNINNVDNQDTNNFENWNNMNKPNIKKMKNIWGNLSKNNIKIVGNGVNNSATALEQKAILDEVQIMITNSLSKNDKSFIQKVIPGIMRVLTNIKDSSSESLNNIFEKITKGYSISELEKIISFLEKFLSTFGYNLPKHRSIIHSITNKNKTGGSNESIYTKAVTYMGLFNILLVFLHFLYDKIDEYYKPTNPYINPINNKYDPFRYQEIERINYNGVTKKKKNRSNKKEVHFNKSKSSKRINQNISVKFSDNLEFKKNDIAIYKGKEQVTIVAVHSDDDEPYFTVRKADDSEVKTTIKHLSYDKWSDINLQNSRTSFKKVYNDKGMNITYKKNTNANLKFLRKMKNNLHRRGIIGAKNFSKERTLKQLKKSPAAKAYNTQKKNIENTLKKFRNSPSSPKKDNSSNFFSGYELFSYIKRDSIREKIIKDFIKTFNRVPTPQEMENINGPTKKIEGRYKSYYGQVNKKIRYEWLALSNADKQNFHNQAKQHMIEK